MCFPPVLQSCIEVMDSTTWHVLDPLRALLDRGGSGGNAELVCDVDAAFALPQTSCC